MITWSVDPEHARVGVLEAFPKRRLRLGWSQMITHETSPFVSDQPIGRKQVPEHIRRHSGLYPALRIAIKRFQGTAKAQIRS
jgi:hypothetical protein